jgi:hypothetical protein
LTSTVVELSSSTVNAGWIGPLFNHSERGSARQNRQVFTPLTLLYWWGKKSTKNCIASNT